MRRREIASSKRTTSDEIIFMKNGNIYEPSSLNELEDPSIANITVSDYIESVLSSGEDTETIRDKLLEITSYASRSVIYVYMMSLIKNAESEMNILRMISQNTSQSDTEYNEVEGDRIYIRITEDKYGLLDNRTIIQNVQRLSDIDKNTLSTYVRVKIEQYEKILNVDYKELKKMLRPQIKDQDLAMESESFFNLKEENVKIEQLRYDRAMLDIQQLTMDYNNFTRTMPLISTREEYKNGTIEGTYAEDDALTIFNRIACSIQVPVALLVRDVSLNNPIKLYQGDRTNFRYFSKMIPHVNSKVEPGTILFIVLNKDKIDNYTSRDYRLAAFNVRKGTFSMEVQLTADVIYNGMKPVALRNVERVMSIETNKWSVTRRTAEWRMLGVTFNKDVFYHMILSDNILSKSLYAKENTTPVSLKGKIDVHYARPMDLIPESLPTRKRTAKSIRISAETEKLSSGMQLISNTGVTIDNPDRFVGSLSLKVSGIRTDSELSEIQRHLEMLMARVMMIYASYHNGYLQFSWYMGGYEQNEKSVTKVSKISQLKAKYPDIFVEKYARAVQGPKQQPDILSPEIARQMLVYGHGHRIMKFVRNPPVGGPYIAPVYYNDTFEDNGVVLLGCLHPQYQFPGLRINKLSNDLAYPYLPQCYLRDHSNNPSSVRFRVERGLPIEAKRSKSISVSRHIASNGSIARIPDDLEQFMQRATGIEANFYRQGKVVSNNSFLQCICDALGWEYDIQYMDQFMMDIRRSMAEELNPEVVKQQMYDSTSDEITDLIMNEEEKFDANIYVRAAEEYFNLNIIVMTNLPPSSNRPSPYEPLSDKTSSTVSYTSSSSGNVPPIFSDSARGTFDIPRHRLYCSRFIKPDRQSIVIYRHFGSDSDALSYAHHELIIGKMVMNNMINTYSLFPFRVAQAYLDAYFIIHSMLMWKPVGDEENRLRVTSEITSTRNILDVLETGGCIVQSQLIDEYGKLRMIKFTRDDTVYTMTTVPQEPLNLPSMLESDMVRASIEDVKKLEDIIGEPTSKYQIVNYIEGLWFSFIEVNDMLFIPIQPVIAANTDYSDLNELLTPITVPETSRLIRKQLIEQSRDRILSILSYLCMVDAREHNIEDVDHNPIRLEVVQRLTSHFNVLSTPPSDTLQFYDIQNYTDIFKQSKRLSDVKTVSEAIQLLNELGVSFIYATSADNWSIDISSSTLAYSLEYFLAQFVRFSRKIGLTPRLLRRRQIRITDFSHQPDTLTFTSVTSLRSWVDNRIAERQRYQVLRRLQHRHIILMKPFIFRLPGDERTSGYFLIQGCRNQEDAIVNCAYWNMYRVNLTSARITDEIRKRVDVRSQPTINHFLNTDGIPLYEDPDTIYPTNLFNAQLVLKSEYSYASLLPLLEREVN
jgi:hypothetical protein